MLTSLISLYIAKSLNSSFDFNITASPSNIEPQAVKTASFDFSNLITTKKIPIKKTQFVSPIINAESSIAIDMETGTILYEKNAHRKREIASITKLMTSLIIMEENEPTEIATVTHNAATTEGSTMYLKPGEQITVENLLFGAIINSANDAAVTLAEHNAGSTQEFVKKMNEKAKSLGLINSHFSNPIGLDSSQNYSTSFDLAKLAQHIYNYDFIKKAAEVKEMKVTSVDGAFTHQLETTNELLEDSYLNIKGLKTGHTQAAGLCLVSIAANDDNKEILTIVLNSPARFKETKILTDWVFRAYNW
ncbi:D-alanyl-D-alanine carboxypeptidase [Candidatus Peregrinibacteria bacterium CG10_big_fil_rev_8_21_14_0_10_36_19]|nr:MAG: D-alanyl-D-alanine carboxypeptidase [Candidatus Peregrinibacteria bacterium CG10_big_fil_rev_8_21_14_0_10_36_19]